MLIEYVQAAMEHAHYKLLEKNVYFGEIPECQGVWADAQTLEKCRESLREVLEEWLVLRLQNGDAIPVLGRYRITAPHSARA